MKKLLSRPSPRFILEGALLGLLLLVSLFSIAVSFYVQGEMITQLETPIMSTLAEGAAVSSGTFEPSSQGHPQAELKGENRPAPAGSRLGIPAE